MAFKIGAKVIWIEQRDNGDSYIVEGTVTKLGKDTVYVDNKHKSEDQRYAAFMWPALAGPKKLLEDTVEMKLRHKKESEEMYIRSIEMNNMCVRNGDK